MRFKVSSTVLSIEEIHEKVNKALAKPVRVEDPTNGIIVIEGGEPEDVFELLLQIRRISIEPLPLQP